MATMDGTTELIARLLVKGGLKARTVGARKLFSVVVANGENGGPLRVAMKSSTELPTRRFQQIRDPRPDDTTERWRYDCLVCLGVSPNGLTIWFLPGNDVAHLIDDGLIAVQHTDSETNSFFPNEKDSACPFAAFIVTPEQLVEKVKAMKPLSG
jgi:hypothetical protein